MKKKIVSEILSTLLLLGMLTLAFNIQPVKTEAIRPPEVGEPTYSRIENTKSLAVNSTLVWAVSPKNFCKLCVLPGQSVDFVVTISNDPSSDTTWYWYGLGFGWNPEYGDFHWVEFPPKIDPGNSWTGTIGTFTVFSTTPLGTLATVGLLTIEVGYGAQPESCEIPVIVVAGFPIRIKVDGSVDPPTVPILNVGNVSYTFTADIHDSIAVEKSNVIIDGAGYTLQGTGTETGYLVCGVNNVTIKRTNISGFKHGVYLHSSSNSTLSSNNITENYIGISSTTSTRNTFCGNNLTDNQDGMMIGGFGLSHSNVIKDNKMKDNARDGIYLGASKNNLIIGNIVVKSVRGITLDWHSDYNIIEDNNILDGSYPVYILGSNNNTINSNNVTNNSASICIFGGSGNNTITGNNIANNGWGILLADPGGNIVDGNNIVNNHGYGGIYVWDSDSNIVSRNNVRANEPYGIYLDSSEDNIIHHNNIVNNTDQAEVYNSYDNTWDAGYPSGGNYWSDHVGADDYSGINQDECGSDGIIDEPYIIDANNRDHYPLVEPWTPVISATVDVVPNTLHLMSQAQWITCYIELPEDYNVSDIDVSTVMLEDTILVSLLDVPAPHPAPTEIGDYDNDTIPDLMVKFDRKMVSEYILSKRITNDYVTLTITGEVDGTPFEGTDTIRVLMTGGGTRGHK